MKKISYSINCGGRMLDLSVPRVMGILNATPDSFYAASRTPDADGLVERARQMTAHGADILDVGACSTRPQAQPVDEQEEMRRLRLVLAPLRQALPEAVVSIDTFRASVAKMCVEEYGADIINDISGGQLDPQMYCTVARLGVPYVLTHNRCTPDGTNLDTRYDDLMLEVLLYFAERLQALRDLGQKDIVIDPGFGFAKGLDDNYRLLARLEQLQVFELPVLVGVSRKRMVREPLAGWSENSANADARVLNATTAVHALALSKGVSILRVHDVLPARDCIDLFRKAQPSE